MQNSLSWIKKTIPLEAFESFHLLYFYLYHLISRADNSIEADVIYVATVQYTIKPKHRRIMRLDRIVVVLSKVRTDAFFIVIVAIEILHA